LLFSFIVGDAAYPLLPWLLKPYPGRGLDDLKDVFNMSLSRSRQVVERCFGMLVRKFRLLKITLERERAKNILMVTAILSLHNLIIAHNVATERYSHVSRFGNDEETLEEYKEQLYSLQTQIFEESQTRGELNIAKSKRDAEAQLLFESRGNRRTQQRPSERINDE